MPSRTQFAASGQAYRSHYCQLCRGIFESSSGRAKFCPACRAATAQGRQRAHNLKFKKKGTKSQPHV